MSPSCRNRPILGGSSCRLQLVDKSVELRVPPSADRLARELRETARSLDGVAFWRH